MRFLLLLAKGRWGNRNRICILAAQRIDGFSRYLYMAKFFSGDASVGTPFSLFSMEVQNIFYARLSHIKRVWTTVCIQTLFGEGCMLLTLYPI